MRKSTIFLLYSHFFSISRLFTFEALTSGLKIKELQDDLLRNFPHNATADQIQLINEVASFLLDRDPHQMFVMKGYAGTGKTTLVQTIIKSLPKHNRKTVLLAPTGRAAKVMSAYTNKKAYTIHKHIYWPKKKVGSYTYELKPNKARQTIYIIDEASMLGNIPDKTFGESGLLDDMVRFSDSGDSCKILLIGDTAQLPPVGVSVSPALVEDDLKLRFFKEVFGFELKEVVRQKSESGILWNATRLRNLLAQEQNNYKYKFDLAADVVRLKEKHELEDCLNDAYANGQIDKSVVLLRSNKRANIYNQQIRTRIRWYEDEITPGDQMMVVRNNYFWLDNHSKTDFIANGDQICLKRIINFEERHGFRFANVEMELLDATESGDIECKLLLDCLYTDGPSLSFDQSSHLFKSVEKEYSSIRTNYKRYQAIKKDPYFNALQVKFAYAITCHKAQGGQWDTVFIEQGYLPEENLDKEYLRWLYTAFTRAVNKVYLIGFKPSFFENEADW